MKRSKPIPPKLPPLIERYLSEDSSLKDFYSYGPNLAGLHRAASNRTFLSSSRRTIVEVLQAQAAESQCTSERTLKNIERLSEEDVYTVVTGHQLCIYGGPMFFPYKILSAIKLAKQLEDKGIKTVPVYWMASEDHDFEEVNHIHIKEDKITWERDSGGPVGAMMLDGIQSFQEELRQIFQNDPIRIATLKRLETIYAPDKNLAQATMDLVHWLFGEMGIVVVDASDKRLKALFAPLMRLELEESFSVDAVETVTSSLNEMGYEGQVTARDVNLFWMEGNVRERIVRDQGGFATSDGSKTWTAESLYELLADEPQKFSPNVVLRPLYQECILPNLAYIGGPGELSYWLQLKGVFDAARVSFPALVLRDMAVILDTKAKKRMDQLGLTSMDVYGDHDALLKEIVRKIGSHEFIVDNRLAQVEGLLLEIEQDLLAFDATLAESARGEKAKVLKRLEALRKKILRADKRANEDAARRLKEFLSTTFPNSAPQERVLNWLAFSHSESNELFFSELLDAFDPLEAKLKVLTA
ncbi:MAG: bacillithiol biosynthesis cysteine-adding enzyme BshC [Cryomorphaceae bacterium]